jgi:NitT/TauT family transport system substrate-binding protein
MDTMKRENWSSTRRREWRRWISFVALAIMVCLSDGGASAEQASGVTAVRIGYTKLRISLPIFVAEQLGLFRKHGIDAKLEAYDTGQPLGQALVEGKIDVGGYFGFPISFNGILRTKRPLLFISLQQEDRVNRISFFLRKKTAPGQKPQIASIKDLRGKRVGILPTIVYKATLEALLRKYGVNPSEVTIQMVEPSLEPQLLASGGVDALYTIDPAATAAIASGVAEIVDPNRSESADLYGEPFPFGSFYISKQWAEANPALTSRIADALDEAIVYINAHQKEAKESLRPYLPAAYHSQIPLYGPALYLTTAQSKEEDVARLARKFKEIGVIPQEIDVTGTVYHVKP